MNKTERVDPCVQGQDWLDSVIQERIASDPEFARLWPESEAGLRLVAMRKDAGLTQAEVAERMGVSQPRVAEIERRPNRVSFGRMQKYLAAVGRRVEFVAEESAGYGGGDGR